MNSKFWKNRNVFLTGHTGFKGGWTSLWLHLMGAKIHGYSLKPKKNSFFISTNLEKKFSNSFYGNINNFKKLKEAMNKSKPSIIIHMAAQPLVRESYKAPMETYLTNIIGTVNVLEAARFTDGVEAIINVTTDKCYENKELNLPFKESDNLGGSDPYSSSKPCSELVTSAYRSSFFSSSNVKIATVRAGNVIGGGDWGKERLIPDFFKCFFSNKVMKVRYPNSIRPWQYVLDLISGYLKLAEKLVENKEEYSGAWNFGPNENRKSLSVIEILNHLSIKCEGINIETEKNLKPHESKFLSLNSSKSRKRLGWKNAWNIERTLDQTLNWYKAWKRSEDLMNISISEIKTYVNELKNN